MSEKYDPKKHAGILFVAGRTLIVADVEQAKLHEMPLGVRQAIAESTRVAQAITPGIPGLLIPDNAEQAQIEADGYRKGIELLQLPEEETK